MLWHPLLLRGGIGTCCCSLGCSHMVHACPLTCCNVNLLSASFCNIPSMSDFKGSSTSFGTVYSPLPIFSYNLYILSPSKGYKPVVMLYLKDIDAPFWYLDNVVYSSVTHNVTPLLHMSTLKPEKLSQPFAISGGWNAGDPWPIVHVSSLENMSNA